MLTNKKVLFLGAGSMAEAMIAGIVKADKIPVTHITVSNYSNKERLQQLKENYGIHTVSRAQLKIEHADIIVLAMKPKDVEEALNLIYPILQPHQLILSVIAGITTSFIEQHLQNNQQVIRVMPNTSSAIGESATAISSGKFTSEQNMIVAKNLLECIGEVYMIEESHMDIFTGIAGSGPAYFYYLMEHMENTATETGLPQPLIREIIAQTILGAAKMVQKEGENPSILRKKVTSPNGTTAAGLEALDSNGGGIAISKAVQQAAEKSKSMSEQWQKSIV
ncbi:pyrroline-5-carboxylate reductase [Niallia sp. Krafla_26]|uniref:pyrroline-5-carboxylate reductase n=1 Tax=Niallia sp. Krafla_26 TaxID=3064703 RepID=UPI003D171ADF